LAKVNGINIIPSIEAFNHATFLTNLTKPVDPTNPTSIEKERDFAFYDDANHRCADTINLSNDTSGSRAVQQLIKEIVTYYAEKFKNAGINTFGLGGDEYVEEMI
jgi:hypothetical protein